MEKLLNELKQGKENRKKKIITNSNKIVLLSSFY